jgi:hypothetical protein
MPAAGEAQRRVRFGDQSACSLPPPRPDLYSHPSHLCRSVSHSRRAVSFHFHRSPDMSRHPTATRSCRRGLLAVAALGAAMLDCRPASAQRPAPSIQVLSLTAPDTVGPYVKTARRDFGVATQGVGYTYESARDSGQVRVTAFIYERDPASADLAPVDAVVRQVAVFRQSMAVEQSRGTLAQYEVVIDAADSTVVTGSGQPVPGHHLYVAQRRGGQVYLTYFSVFAIGNGYIKMRCTVAADGWERWNVGGLATAIVQRTLAGI